MSPLLFLSCEHTYDNSKPDINVSTSHPILTTSPPLHSPYHNPLITILTGHGHGHLTHTFTLPSTTLSFWSPYMRNLIHWYTPALIPNLPPIYQNPITINLPHIDAGAFQLFVEWITGKKELTPSMRTQLADFSQDHRNREGKGNVGEEVALAIRTWCMTHLFSGASLILRDAVLKRIYTQYLPYHLPY
jgi:hypothetical protein